MGGRLWREAEKARLRLLWGTMSLADLARTLGRSQTAVNVMRKRLGLRSPQYWEHYLMVVRLAEALGVDTKTAQALLEDGRLDEFVVTLWCGNTPIPAVPLLSLEKWVGNPANWYALDVEKVRHPRLVRAVAAARRWWKDEWIGTKEACEMLHVSPSWLTEQLRSGQMAGRKWGHNWRLLRSVVEGRARELQQAEGWLRVALDELNYTQFRNL